jgi:hypothetical protein
MLHAVPISKPKSNRICVGDKKCHVPCTAVSKPLIIVNYREWYLWIRRSKADVLTVLPAGRAQDLESTQTDRQNLRTARLCNHHSVAFGTSRVQTSAALAETLRGFPQSIQANASEAPWIIWTLPSTSFPIHYLLITLLFDDITVRSRNCR